MDVEQSQSTPAISKLVSVVRGVFFGIPFCIIITIIVTLEFTIGLAVAIVVIPLTYPYTYFYYSSNWAMLEPDMPIVQLYLDHFQSLYPELISHVAAENRSIYLQQSTELQQSTPAALRKRVPGSIDFWPKSTNYHVTDGRPHYHWMTRHHFTQAAGLFFQLEDAGWSRKVLWTFLRDQVEERGLVSQEEMEQYAAVMTKMCSHNLVGLFWPLPNKAVHTFLTKWYISGLKQWDGDGEVPAGMSIVHVSLDSVEWLLQGGALLVASDVRTFQCMQRLSAFQIWGKLKSSSTLGDIEEGRRDHWQVMSLASSELYQTAGTCGQ